MGTAVEGPTGVGKAANRPPVVVAGVDDQGKVRPILVAADGTIQVTVAP